MREKEFWVYLLIALVRDFLAGATSISLLVLAVFATRPRAFAIVFLIKGTNKM